MPQLGQDENQSPQGQEKKSPWEIAQERAQGAPIDLRLESSERMLGISLLASLIASLIAGIGARLIMRIVAVTAHMPPSFSIAGTLNIVFLVLFLGLVPGFVYALCLFFLSSSTKLSKHLPGSLWRGLAFGVLLLVIVGLPSLLIPLLPKEDLNLGSPLLNRGMFAALPLLYGMTLGGAEAILDRSFPRKPASSPGERSSPQLQEEEQVAKPIQER
jgi:hypothetical protein